MIGYVILAAVALLLAVLVIRALLFNPKPQNYDAPEALEFDRQGAVNALQKLVQCKTISYNDPSLEDDGEFEKLVSLLPGLYPKVFEVCSFQRLPDRALLLR